MDMDMDMGMTMEITKQKICDMSCVGICLGKR